MKLVELTEGAVSKSQRPQFDVLEVDGAIALLNKECKNALWMLKKDLPFFRGMTPIGGISKTGFALVDTSATERESANTTNYYTVLLDNHPDRKEFPKRSRSFIASTDYDRAFVYAVRDPYVLIPTDNAKIGCVHHEDMWDTKIKLFGDESTIEDVNRWWEDLGLKENIESFIKFDKDLKAGKQAAIDRFNDVFESDTYKRYGQRFLESIWKAYSAQQTGHKVYTTATFPQRQLRSEVWVGGEVVIITEEMWEALRKALKKS